jgi:hypothetical protein
MLRSLTPILSIVVLTFSACGGPEPPFGETESRLVVISEFSSDRTFEVQVSRARTVFDRDTSSRYINNATVQIFRDTVFLGTLSLDGSRTPPSYTNNDILPLPNIGYRVVVEAPGYPPVTAHSRIPGRIPILPLEIVDFREKEGARPGETEFRYGVTIQFDDPAGDINFYHLNLFQQVRIAQTPGKEVPHGNFVKIPDLSFLGDHTFIALKGGGLLFNDDAFNGRSFSMVFPLNFTLSSDEELGKLFVELRAVSEDYYLFQKSLAQQADGPGLPVQGDVPVYNNIQNGLGIFAGYNPTVDSITVFR